MTNDDLAALVARLYKVADKHGMVKDDHKTMMEVASQLEGLQIRAERAEAELSVAYILLDRCRTVLANMAMENEGAVFNRWKIKAEPLRNDARGLLPDLDDMLGIRDE
jgi:hypothetical protein